MGPLVNGIGEEDTLEQQLQRRSVIDAFEKWRAYDRAHTHVFAFRETLLEETGYDHSNPALNAALLNLIVEGVTGYNHSLFEGGDMKPLYNAFQRMLAHLVRHQVANQPGVHILFTPYEAQGYTAYRGKQALEQLIKEMEIRAKIVLACNTSALLDNACNELDRIYQLHQKWVEFSALYHSGTRFNSPPVQFYTAVPMLDFFLWAVEHGRRAHQLQGIVQTFIQQMPRPFQPDEDWLTLKSWETWQNRFGHEVVPFNVTLRPRSVANRIINMGMRRVLSRAGLNVILSADLPGAPADETMVAFLAAQQRGFNAQSFPWRLALSKREHAYELLKAMSTSVWGPDNEQERAQCRQAADQLVYGFLTLFQRCPPTRSAFDVLQAYFQVGDDTLVPGLKLKGRLETALKAHQSVFKDDQVIPADNVMVILTQALSFQKTQELSRLRDRENASFNVDQGVQALAKTYDDVRAEGLTAHPGIPLLLSGVVSPRSVPRSSFGDDKRTEQIRLDPDYTPRQADDLGVTSVPGVLLPVIVDTLAQQRQQQKELYTRAGLSPAQEPQLVAGWAPTDLGWGEALSDILRRVAAGQKGSGQKGDEKSSYPFPLHLSTSY